MPKPLQCSVCGKPILRRKDLLVTNKAFVKFLVFHQDCYRQAVNQGKYFGRPAIGSARDISTAIILVVALVFYIKTRNPLLLTVLIGAPLYRLVIWWRFERPLLPGE